MKPLVCVPSLINSLLARGSLHGDDIRTLATSESVLNAQTSIVHEFAAANFLKLKCTKCEIVVFSRAPTSVNLNDASIPIRAESKCLNGFSDLFCHLCN